MLAPGQFLSLARSFPILRVPTISEIRHANLLLLIGEGPGSIQRFATLIGRSHSQVSQLKNRSKHSKSGLPREVGGDVARHIETSLGLDNGWMDTPHPTSKSVINPHPSQSLEAQLVSLETFTVAALLSWEGLVRLKEDELPESFRVAMPDASLRGDIEQGAELIFERGTARLAPGKAVLLKDRDGNRFIRRYSEVRGGHWKAVSTTDYFDTLDSIEHGLTVLAVMRWRED